MKTRKEKAAERKFRYSLMLIFVGVILLFILVGSLLLITSLLITSAVGVEVSGGLGFIVFCIIEVLLLSIVLAFSTSRLFLKPINIFVNAMNALALGDFSRRINPPKPWGNIPVIKEICESFNRTAEELSHTEMLREDFVNNFSHEFKTPIVSILGFAKLLKNQNLDDKDRDDYLSIIIEESERLTALATNTLKLTKIENQEILSGKENYNLTEQIRGCIILLLDKFTLKNIEFNLTDEEIYVFGNAELLKEVWLNLLDNALKFTPNGGRVSIKINKEERVLTVSIANSGEKIPEEKKDLIFRKFYQLDTSHSTKGNGIGLALVKKIVDLHNGKIILSYKDEMNVFSVILPN